MAADEKSIPSFLDLRSARSRKTKSRIGTNDIPQLAFDLSLPPEPIVVSQPERIPTSARLPAEPILYTVRQLIAELRQHVEGAYTGILNVEGEISNCRPAASGHLYFTLKDGDAQLPVVLFRRSAQLLGFKPKDGLAVEVRGRISVYETRGQLQLIAESLRPRGTGALQLAFEQLRDRLRREGLFDRPRTPLPSFPHCIGIVTSPSGAAIRDIIHVVRRRHARLNLLIYPAVMQGVQCPPSVIQGIRWFNRNPDRVDLILVARGGGSLEDLAGFNDEALAHAIVASKLPVVAAIGHEIDHTIAEYVADLRAPTPSAAAELITSAQHRIEERVTSLDRRILRAAEYQLLRARQRLQRLSAEQVLARLRDSIGRRQQRIDELRFRLDYANVRLQRHKASRVAALEARLRRHDPTVRIAHVTRRLEIARSRLTAVSQQITSTRRSRLERAMLRLESLSPLAVLNRGYAIVYLEPREADTPEVVLQNSAIAQPHQTIRARLAQGSVRARILENRSIGESAKMKKLFGTDGIRAVAGQPPLDNRTIYAIGLALASTLKQLQPKPRLLLGMDTRESSRHIAGILTAGLTEAGATVENAGVITTPAIAHLAHTHRFAAGIVISASHNPWQDNGIKLFGPDGFKLPDATELTIEQEIFAQLNELGAPGLASETWASTEAPAINEADRAEYIRFLLAAVPNLSLDNQTIIIDCANGAASAVAPQLFADLGGNVIVTHASPDGRNINQGCGALHPEVVAAEVTRHKASLGITFDGDADRALFADEHGHVVNGDAVLLLAARDLHARGLLANATVVATTMSNMGLEAALSRSGIAMIRAAVGDKYVLEQMLATGATLGGEQSGHIIFSGRSTTGDGLLTALLVLDIIHRSGKSLAELTADLKTFPQVIVNVKVREKRPMTEIPSVVDTIAAAEQALAGTGRVVIRYSGTEALARVMIEAEDETQMTHHAQAIATAIRESIGL